MKYFTKCLMFITSYTTIYCSIFLLLSTLISPLKTYASECPKSIVSLTLASDEILLDIISDKNRISGVTYLASDQNISNIHDQVSQIPGIYANLEQIIELGPDLLIVSIYKNIDVKEQLKNAGINTLYLDDITSFRSLKNNIEKIGNAVCEVKNASRLISEMENKLESIIKKVPKNKRRPNILFYSPPGFTAGEESTVNEIIQKAGGVNIGASIGKNSYQKISMEFIVESNPDIILLSSYNPVNPDFQKEFISNSVLKDISAVKNNRVIIIPGKYLTSASHYVVYAVEELVNNLLEQYWQIEYSNQFKN